MQVFPLWEREGLRRTEESKRIYIRELFTKRRGPRLISHCKESDPPSRRFSFCLCFSSFFLLFFLMFSISFFSSRPKSCNSINMKGSKYFPAILVCNSLHASSKSHSIVVPTTPLRSKDSVSWSGLLRGLPLVREDECTDPAGYQNPEVQIPGKASEELSS